jgi:hypothetical protein
MCQALDQQAHDPAPPTSSSGARDIAANQDSRHRQSTIHQKCHSRFALEPAPPHKTLNCSSKPPLNLSTPHTSSCTLTTNLLDTAGGRPSSGIRRPCRSRRAGVAHSRKVLQLSPMPKWKVSFLSVTVTSGSRAMPSCASAIAVCFTVVVHHHAGLSVSRTRRELGS